MVEFSLDIGNNSAIRRIDRMAKERGFMEKKIMNRVGQAMVSNVQTNYLRGQVLKRQSGNLAASMQFRLTGQHSFRIGPGMVYGAAHEFGIALSDNKYIYPVRGKALRFSVGGKVTFARRVRQHVPKRPYLAPSIQEYLQSGKSKIDVEQTIQDWLDRLK